MRNKGLNVAIIGMGSGGFALARILSEEHNVKVVGVANRRQEVEGIQWAEKHGIFTTSDFRELVNHPEVNIVIDASGSAEVEEYLASVHLPGLEIIRGLTALMMWRLVEEREEKERETQKRLAEQQYLYDIGITLTTAENSGEALRLIVMAAMDLLEMAAGSVALFNEEKGEMRMAHAVGFKDENMAGMTWSVVPGGFTEHILNADEPVAVEDLSKETQFDTSRLQKEGFLSLIAIPLIVAGKIVGILYADHQKPRKFKPSDISLMGLLGTLAASAIEKILGFEAAEKRADTDGLTRLYNQRFFKGALMSELKRAERYSEKLSVIMIDVDHFKKFNDTHGHVKGDEVLRCVAQILQVNARETDIVGRYGGEEFGVILPRATKELALQVAERLCKQVREAPFAGEETQPGGKVTISVGLATYPDDAGDEPSVTTMLERADQALYRSKEAGRDRVTCYGDRRKVS